MPLVESGGGSSDRRAVRGTGRIGDFRMAVMSAKQLSSDELMRRSFGTDSHVTIDCCCCSFIVRCFCPSELTANHKARLFSILEKNMKTASCTIVLELELYMNSSWGWNGGTKFDELFATDSRLLLCFLTNLKTCCDSGLHDVTPPPPTSPDEPCAFVHFRFEVDTQRPVLYCYEIQLLEEVRGLKLGQKLLHILYKVAAINQMTRVILTVFRFNYPAYTFFTKNGFKTDTSDPSRYGQSVDYSILSRLP
ncbi:N-alpha-acetyltransferase 40 [Taenia solium]|eukprot:TsM_000122800 transcript=TsM_000122800 gene=TsM_000122800